MDTQKTRADAWAIAEAAALEFLGKSSKLPGEMVSPESLTKILTEQIKDAFPDALHHYHDFVDAGMIQAAEERFESAFALAGVMAAMLALKEIE